MYMRSAVVLLVLVAAGPGILEAQSPLPAATEARIDALESKVIAWRRDFHEHPELGNREFRTAKIVAEHLASLGIEVETGVAHTGVVGVLRGPADPERARLAHESERRAALPLPGSELARGRRGGRFGGCTVRWRSTAAGRCRERQHDDAAAVAKKGPDPFAEHVRTGTSTETSPTPCCPAIETGDCDSLRAPAPSPG